MVVAPTVAARHMRRRRAPCPIMSQQSVSTSTPQHQGLRPEPHDRGGRARLLRLRPASVAEWALGFESPKAVYESGVTGFTSAAPCAPSASTAPSGPSRRCSAWPPTAAARLTAATPSSSPACSRRATSSGSGCPTSAPRRPATFPRAGRRARRPAAPKQRMSKFPLRHGHVFDEPTPTGGRRGSWTRAYWRWADAIEFVEPDDAAAYEHYRDCVRRCGEARDALARRVAESAGRPSGSRPWTRSGA